MITCDVTTANELNAPNLSKLGYSNIVIAALLNNRRITIKKDTTTIFDAELLGDFKTLEGNITSIGTIGNVITHIPADVTSGTCYVTLSSGLRYIKGTLGLSPEAQIARYIAAGKTQDQAALLVINHDFTINDNPTNLTGFAVLSSLKIQAPVTYPSGTGPVAPVKTLDAPNTIRIWDWSDPANPVVAVTMSLSLRLSDWVYQDTDLAASTGDGAIYQTPTDSVWGNFLMGATMTIANPSCTVAGVNPLYQVAVAFAHTYPGYPDITNYSKKNTILNLPPFKATLHNGRDELMYTWQAPDGSANNDPNHESSMNRSAPSTTKPMYAKFNCRMGLIWESEAPSVTTIAHKLHPGVASDYRLSMAKMQYSIGTTEPLITGGYGGDQKNCLGAYQYTTQYPLPFVDHTLTDPYLAGDPNNPGSSSQYTPWMTGWDYFPAAIGMHGWYPGPGGQRADRGPVHSIYVAFLTDPTGNRLQDNTSWRAMADGTRKNYWNQANLLVSSPSKLYLDTNSALMDGYSWSSIGNYYGDYPYRGKAFMMNGNQPGGSTDDSYDVNGDMVINGWSRDSLHMYSQRGYSAWFFNSHIDAIGSKFDSFTGCVVTRAATSDESSNYQIRGQAWDFQNHMVGWKLGSTHPLGISQEEWAVRFDKVLAAIYQFTYKPAFIDNAQTVYARALRNLGINLQQDNQYYYTPGGRLGLYMGILLPLMKQSGFWSAMRKRNAINAIVLDNLIRNWDKFCFDNILDTSGGTGFGDKYWVGLISDPDNVITSWSAYTGAVGGFMSDANGNFSADPDSSIHLMMNYIRMRPLYFPEYPNARLNDALAKLAAYEAQVKARVDAASTPFTKTQVDYHYRYHAIAPLAPPTVLGPQ